MRVIPPDTEWPIRAEVRTSPGHPGLDPSAGRAAGATAPILRTYAHPARMSRPGSGPHSPTSKWTDPKSPVYACRVYATPAGLSGVSPLDDVIFALTVASDREPVSPE